jgi:hypothetical protein
VCQLTPEKAGVKPLSPRGRGVGERGANLAASVLPLSPVPSPTRGEGSTAR